MVAAFERIYPELAAKYGVLLYPFFLDGVAADLSLTQQDGLHPNAAGVGVIVAADFAQSARSSSPRSGRKNRRKGCAPVAIAACCGGDESHEPELVMPRLFTGLEIPPSVAQSLAHHARRIAGGALDHA